MPSSIELAARLSAVVSLQQETLAVINDPDKVMQLVVNRTPEVTNGTGAVIEMAEGTDLVYRAASGTAAKQLGLRLSIGSSLSGAAVREGRPIRCDNVDLDPRVNSAAAHAVGIRSMIIAPLVHGSTTIGALKTFSDRANAFDDLDAYTLQVLAGITSVALMQAHEFRERQASEQRYRMLFERNVAGVFRTTLDGRFLDCNEALVSYLGYDSREDLLAHQTWDIYHQRADRERFLQQLARDRVLTNLRMHLKKKDGSSVTGVVNATIIPAEEGETQVLGTMVEET
jgi:PAS domain S-box-containing protein